MKFITAKNFFENDFKQAEVDCFYLRLFRYVFQKKIMTKTESKMNINITYKTESGVMGKVPFETPVDSRISYPSYKSLDEFIDTDRLRSLDGYITQRIKRHLKTQDDLKFYTGPYRLESNTPTHPGSRMIYLAYSELPDNYFDLDKTELWHPTIYANEFALLMDFISTLPFEKTGRMLIMYDSEPREIPAHRDHIETDVCHEFIWFRTNPRKPFYMLNEKTLEKKYIEGYSAWFDTVNQYHGCNSFTGISFSVRVDGKFTDEFRAKIPKPEFNLASTPSYWTAMEK